MTGTRKLTAATVVVSLAGLTSLLGIRQADASATGPFKYVTSHFTASATSNFAGSASCPDGYRVTGGGGDLPGAAGDQHVSSIGPFDFLHIPPFVYDPDTDADDGFVFDGWNGSGDNLDMTVNAVCLKDPDGLLTYASHTQTFGTGALGSGGSTSCTGNLVGGGVTMSGTQQENYLLASYPYLFSGDTWQYSFNKDSTADSRDYTDHAICLPDGVRHVRRVSKEVVVDEQMPRTLRATCPSTYHVSAGGIQGSFLSIDASRPFDGSDADHATDDGWSARVFNPTFGPQSFRVWAICVR